MQKFGAGAILISDGYTLLQSRSATEHEPLTWCVFGGMRQGRETPEKTMMREVLEESGINVAGHRRWLADTFFDHGDTFHFHTYVVILDARPIPVPSSETHETCWIPLGETPLTLWKNVPRPLQSGFAELVQKERVAKDIYWRTSRGYDWRQRHTSPCTASSPRAAA